MTDRYERIRDALAMGPTPGPWKAEPENTPPMSIDSAAAGAVLHGCGCCDSPNMSVEDAAHIAACDPDTIRALLAERDALAAALEAARKDAESLREVLHDEIEANLKFREAGGASPDEDMPTFCARLLAERAEYRDRSLRLAVKYVVQKGRTAAAINQARGRETGMAEFMVFEQCDDYEQALTLRTGKHLPPGGILDWCERKPREAAAVFPSRAEARGAISRTEHYRLAFGSTRLPEKKFCTVVPVARVRLVPEPPEAE